MHICTCNNGSRNWLVITSASAKAKALAGQLNCDNKCNFMSPTMHATQAE